ncbi:MAG: hypothetical protein KIT09_32840 [Bryobacteraceae bacterium]|nr:hypothetical protein [Bryobacteraceae bacterium]
MRKFKHLAVTMLILPLGVAMANDHDKTSSKKAGKTTITGCLQQGAAGSYMITDNTGKQVTVITADTGRTGTATDATRSNGTVRDQTGRNGNVTESKLAQHVNHTVRLTGKYTDQSARSETATTERDATTSERTTEQSGTVERDATATTDHHSTTTRSDHAMTSGSFKVNKIEHISETCSVSGTGANSSTSPDYNRNPDSSNPNQ